MVELRFFGGLSLEEIADVLDVSVETVKRDWRLARLWLARTLQVYATRDLVFSESGRCTRRRANREWRIGRPCRRTAPGCSSRRWMRPSGSRVGWCQPMEARPGGVGPDGQCTSAAWSPDGKWMYFSSDSSGSFHIWRQRFPEGAPEQITDGPTEEAGIPPDPDGRSLLTSVGSRHSSIWIHDERGEREISREGYAFIPKTPNGGTSQPLSADGRSVYYLVRQGAVRFGGVGERVGELWAADVATGASKPIVTGRNVIGYDSSHDGTQLAFAALDDRGVAHVWLMRLDRANEPRQISTLEMDSPRFNRAGDVFCRGRENGQTFVYRLRPGGAPEKLLNSSAETLIMPLGPGGAMPAFPAEGFQSKADLAGLSVAHATNGWGYPIGTGSTYVFARASTQRNIYRIALR